MELINAIDKKFKKIEAKISLKSNLIEFFANLNYHEVQNNLFIQEEYETWLNQSRELMLKQIIEDRDEKLSQVNECIHSKKPKRARIGQDELLNNIKSLSSSNLRFYPCLFSVYESILARAKFNNELSLSKLAKYSLFFQNEKFYCYKNVLDLLKTEYFFKLHKLTSNLILLCSHTNDFQSYMVIIDKNGQIIKYAKLNSWCYVIRANKTNIVTCFESKIDIYNFNLDLVNSFMLDRSSKSQRYDDFRLFNQEIGYLSMLDYGKTRFTCLSYNNKSPKKISLDFKLISAISKDSEWSKEKATIVLEDFNENSFIVSLRLSYAPVCLYLFSRGNSQLLYAYEWSSNLSNLFILNCAEVCFVDEDERKIHVYNQNNKNCDAVEVKDGKFFNIYFTSNNKHIRSLGVIQEKEFIVLSEC